MAIMVMQDFAEGSTGLYNQILAMLNLGGKNPPGNLFHSAGMVEGSLRTVDVWESEAALQAFGAKLGPMVQSTGMPAPTVTIWAIHRSVSAGSITIGE